MNPSDEAFSIKRKNVIDMAITFTAMSRVFEKGSKAIIAQALEDSLAKLASVDTRQSFERVHGDFCARFTESISTAAKELKNKRSKKSRPASYGHAAKVFDIAAKVYVYYCHLPSCDSAGRLMPLLHGAVDTPILRNLKARYSESGIAAKTIEAVEEREYAALQALVVRHIRDEFHDLILPVQYDDIMWHRLNRQP
jgi:hypothetical protein